MQWRICNIYPEDKDIDEVIKINSQCLPEKYTKEFLVDMVTNNEGFCVHVMSEEDHGWMGYLLSRKEDDILYIVSIAVLPEFRHQHIASRMVNMIIGRAVNKGFKRIDLHVRVGNLEAIHLYERFNFARVEEVEGYYKDGADAWLMQRWLGQRYLGGSK